MNNKTQNLIELDKQYLWHPFTQMKCWLASEPVIIESGDGFYLIDTEGRRYIDGVSSLWCNVFGHRVKKIDEAIRGQLAKIAHSTLLGLGQSKSIELAEQLIKIAPSNLQKVFYSDSGATAVEIALKMAYQYWRNRGMKRDKFIALGQSYHGDTIGSVSVGGMELFHSIFRPLLFETYFVPPPFPYRFDGTAEDCKNYSLGKMEEFLQNRSGEVAAVIIEPLVQGAAGMLVHPRGFLQAVSQLTKKYDVLLIADEVATGFGKTGEMFACQVENVQPDIMTVAKGITGGYLPLAATLTAEEIFNGFLGEPKDFKTFYHGHTYTGNALACAAAIANLELFEEEKVIASLPAKIKLIADELAKISLLEFIGDVRQCGIMTAIEIVRDKNTKQSFEYERQIGAKVCAAMRPKGVMLRPLGDCVILMPPVGIDLPTLQKLLEIVYDTLAADLPKIITT